MYRSRNKIDVSHRLVGDDNEDQIKTSNQDKLIEGVNDEGNNPLLLYPVVECVYKFLNLEDIKRFRLVCHEWNYSAMLILRKRSKIVLSKNKAQKSNLILSKFNEVFSATANIPFTTFSINNGVKWNVNELKDFFNSQKNLKELELDRIFVVNDSGQQINNFSDIPWISKPLSARANGSLISKLCISGCYEYPLTVPIDTLVTVKDITLSWCFVDITEQHQISPISIKLSNVRFYRGGGTCERIRINDVINFPKLKTAELLSYGTQIILDVGENGEVVNLKRCKLLRVNVINWRSSNWNVKNLVLNAMPFAGIPGTGMKILEMDFRKQNIDLFYLPQSIEKLTIHRVDKYNGKVFCSQGIALQNLKYLYLDIDDINTRSTISYFSNCPKLEHIYFYGKCIRIGGQLRMRLNWNCDTVKTLTLDCGPIIFDATGLSLDKLILYDFTHYDAKTVFVSDIRVKDLILYCISPRNTHDTFLDFMEYLKFKRCHVQRIYAGPFNWTENSPDNNKSCSFERSSLRSYVDEEAKYYVFESRRGKSISETEFHSLILKAEEEEDVL